MNVVTILISNIYKKNIASLIRVLNIFKLLSKPLMSNILLCYFQAVILFLIIYEKKNKNSKRL